MAQILKLKTTLFIIGTIVPTGGFKVKKFMSLTLVLLISARMAEAGFTSHWLGGKNGHSPLQQAFATCHEKSQAKEFLPSLHDSRNSDYYTQVNIDILAFQDIYSDDMAKALRLVEEPFAGGNSLFPNIPEGKRHKNLAAFYPGEHKDPWINCAILKAKNMGEYKAIRTKIEIENRNNRLSYPDYSPLRDNCQLQNYPIDIIDDLYKKASTFSASENFCQAADKAVKELNAALKAERQSDCFKSNNLYRQFIANIQQQIASKNKDVIYNTFPHACKIAKSDPTRHHTGTLKADKQKSSQSNQTEKATQ